LIAADPGSTGLPISEGGLDVNNQFTDGYWSVAAANSLVSTNYDLELTGNGQAAVTFNKASNENMYVAGNIEVMPLWEVSVFVAGNYETSSDDRGSFVSTSDDDAICVESRTCGSSGISRIATLIIPLRNGCSTRYAGICF